MSRFKDATVLITGAGSGIGALIAERAAKEGAANLILWDKNYDAIDTIANTLAGGSCVVHLHEVDVADSALVERSAKNVLRMIGPVDILFNNAGIVTGDYFRRQDAESIEQIVQVNVLGVMRVARAFLPTMAERGSGHIVNIASAAGLLPNPGMAVYAGSKWGVLGWSESLRLELERERTGVKVTTVTPSYIDTGMFAGVSPPLLTPLMKPEVAVNRIMKAVKADRIILRMPRIVYILPLLRGLLPARVFDAIVGRGLGVYRSMDTFHGRGGDSEKT